MWCLCWRLWSWSLASWRTSLSSSKMQTCEESSLSTSSCSPCRATLSKMPQWSSALAQSGICRLIGTWRSQESTFGQPFSTGSISRSTRDGRELQHTATTTRIQRAWKVRMMVRSLGLSEDYNELIFYILLTYFKSLLVFSSTNVNWALNFL